MSPDNKDYKKNKLQTQLTSASGAVAIGHITVYGGKVTQKLLKSMVAKWLPGIGTVAMAAWSKISTNMIGKKAKDILANEIIIEADMLEASQLQIEEEMISTVDHELIIKNKILLMANLMKIDGNIAQAEIELITAMIEGVNISDDLTFELIELLTMPEKGKVDFELLKENEEAVSLLIDMASIAGCDGELHAHERLYIKQSGMSLGLSGKEIDEIINIG